MTLVTVLNAYVKKYQFWFGSPQSFVGAVGRVTVF